MATQPKLELFYGGAYFKGDAIRHCCAYAGLAFDDVRKGEERWQEFEAMKAGGRLPFGQQPVMRVGGADGQLIAQSVAIVRMVAQLAGPSLELYPQDPILAAKVDGILAQDDDMRTGFCCFNYQARFGFDGALGGKDTAPARAVRAALLDTVLPRHLSYFERLLSESATGWLAGTEKPTIADFYMSGSLAWLGLSLDKVDILEPYPKIRALIEKVGAIPSVKAWEDAHAYDYADLRRQQGLKPSL